MRRLAELTLAAATLALAACGATGNKNCSPGCPAGQTCNAGACLQNGGSCSSSADCTVANTPICSSASRTCVACSATEACAGSLKCSTSGACVACTGSVDCTDPQKPECDPAAHVCGPCAGD